MSTVIDNETSVVVLAVGTYDQIREDLHDALDTAKTLRSKLWSKERECIDLGNRVAELEKAAPGERASRLLEAIDLAYTVPSGPTIRRCYIDNSKYRAWTEHKGRQFSAFRQDPVEAVQSIIDQIRAYEEALKQ